MKKWLKRIRGALGMGLTWAVGWTVTGMLIMVTTYTIFPDLPDVVDIWIPVFAYPGFLCGVVFSAVLRMAAGRRRFDELSLPGFAALGAAGGLTIGGLFFAMAAGEVATGVLAIVLGNTTLLSAASASGSLALARRAEDRELLAASTDVAEVGLTRDEARELLGGRG